MDHQSSLSTAAVAATAETLASDAGAVPATTTLAAVGDCQIARRVSALRDPELHDLVGLLRGADCTWASCETVFVEPGHAWPGYQRNRPHASCEPWGADELAWMGIDCLSLANDHTMDFGYQGLVATLENLKRVGIGHAGAGVDLAAASRPGYVDTPGGRVGQVSLADSSLPLANATMANPHVQGRPGIHGVRLERGIEVPEKTFQRLREVRAWVGELEGEGRFPELYERDDGGRIGFGFPFVCGEKLELSMEIQPEQLERFTAGVAAARNHSRLVLGAFHSHCGRGAPELPPPYVTTVAHAAIDAGADAFFGTGPGVLRGIELYQGKPIFYSLGNFLFQYESMQQIPSEILRDFGHDPRTTDLATFYDAFPYPREKAYWESVVARITYAGGELAGIDLHPITLGFGQPRHRRGTPMLARGEQADAILARLAALSQPFGTSITVRDGVGRVEPG